MHTEKDDFQPLVSIIINCFNGEKFLNETINSVLLQTYQNWEIIFWDNNSNDGSVDIIKSYNDKRIKYFLSKEHTKLYHARKFAIQESEGDLIAFLDVDDYWLEDNLNEQVRVFKDIEVGFSCANFFYKNQSNKNKIAFRNKMPSGFILSDLLKNYSIPLLTLVFRRSIFKNIDCIFDSDYNYIGDFDLVVRLSSLSKLYRIHKPLAVYRDHEKNMSKRNHDEQISELENWNLKNKNIPVISDNINYKWVGIKIDYMKGINCVFIGKRWNAINLLLKLPFCLMKFKLLVIILLPQRILIKLLLHR